MSDIKVSIIVPVYNAERYLKGCLDSLVAQTLEGIEIIAVDDGSTDGSGAILEEYQGRFTDRLTVVHTKNKGVSSARNTALSMAGGSYIQFVDADDYISKDMCAKLYEIAKTKDCDMVICDRYDVYETDEGCAERKGENPHTLEMTGESFTPRDNGEFYIRISPYPWDKLIRRELALKAEFPEGIRFEDLTYIYTVAALAEKVAWIDEPLYFYRKNTGFLSGYSEGTKDILKALSKLKENFDRFEIEGLSKELEFIFARHIILRYRTFMGAGGRISFRDRAHFVSESWDYLKMHYPHWKKNVYYLTCFPERKAMHAEVFMCKAAVMAVMMYCDLKMKFKKSLKRL